MLLILSSLYKRYVVDLAGGEVDSTDKTCY